MRSLHVYGLNDGKEKQVEREFLFKERGSYVEMQATPILKLRGFQVSELFQGRAIGLWLCIFAFGAQSSLAFVDIPPKLLISRYICFHFCFFFQILLFYDALPAAVSNLLFNLINLIANFI